MTIHEINLVIRGYRRRLLAYQAIAAFSGAISVQPWLKSGSPLRAPIEDDDGDDE